MSGLQDLLSEGYSCGAHQGELYMKLEEWQENATRWRTRAVSVLNMLDSAADQVDTAFRSCRVPLIRLTSSALSVGLCVIFIVRSHS